MKFEDIVKLYNDKKYESAYLAWFELAKKEDVAAMLQIAYMLINGEGIEKNIEEGYEWYKKASDKNKASAQYYYGWYCLEKKQVEIGQEYLNKAMENEYVDAIYAVAGLYAFGDFGYSKDFQKAIKLYKRACLLGKKGACIDLYIVNKKLVGKMKSARYMIDNIGILKFLRIVVFS